MPNGKKTFTTLPILVEKVFGNGGFKLTTIDTNERDELFIGNTADKLDRLRDSRISKKITYKCMFARFPQVGTRVKCSMGRDLNPTAADGAMDLVSVLSGRTGEGCRHCPMYNSLEE